MSATDMDTVFVLALLTNTHKLQLEEGVLRYTDSVQVKPGHTNCQPEGLLDATSRIWYEVLQDNEEKSWNRCPVGG